MRGLILGMLFVVGCAKDGGGTGGGVEPKTSYGYSSAFIVVEGEVLPGAVVTTKEAEVGLRTAIGVMVEQ